MPRHTRKKSMMEFLDKPKHSGGRKAPEFTEDEKARIKQEAMTARLSPPPEKGMYNISIDPLDPQSRKYPIQRHEMPESMMEQFEVERKMAERKRKK